MYIDRLTGRAIEVLSLAAARARKMRSETVGLRVLLEALMQLDPEGTAAGIQASGTTLDEVHRRIAAAAAATGGSRLSRVLAGFRGGGPGATSLDDSVAAIVVTAADEAAVNGTRADAADLAHALASYVLGVVPPTVEAVIVSSPSPPAEEPPAAQDAPGSSLEDRFRLLDLDLPELPCPPSHKY